VRVDTNISREVGGYYYSWSLIVSKEDDLSDGEDLSVVEAPDAGPRKRGPR
jgi:hypothetical protein